MPTNLTRVSLCLAVAVLGASIDLPAADGQQKVVQHGHTDGIMSLAFSPNGKLLATGGHDHVIHLWESNTGKRVRTLAGHPGNVTCVAFSPDGKTLASGSYAARRSDFSLILWSVATGEILHGIPAASSFDVYAVCFSRDGRTVVTGGDDWLINFWDVRSGKGRMVRRHGVVTSLILLPDGKQFVVGGRSKTVSLVNSNSGEIVRTFSGHAASVWRLDLSPDGKILASADGEGTVRVWELTTGKLQHSIKDAGTGAKFSPDGRFLATRHGNPAMKSPSTIRLWNVKTGQRLTELRGHTDWIEGIAFSPDGKQLASGGYDSSIRIWDISEFAKGRP